MTYTLEEPLKRKLKTLQEQQIIALLELDKQLNGAKAL